ncbi:MAG: hypothetical protein IBX72_03895 [Nitrospirae bacterium]|nr:hypothetical protein [Nitrospirota bacterium]
MEKKKKKKKRKSISKSKGVTYPEYPGEPRLKPTKMLLYGEKESSVDGFAITGNWNKTSIRLTIEASHEDWKKLNEYISFRHCEMSRRREELISKYITSTSNEDLKINAIVAAISELNPETNFTTEGLPKVEAIEQYLDLQVSIKERDLAWQRYKERQEVHTSTGLKSGVDVNHTVESPEERLRRLKGETGITQIAPSGPTVIKEVETRTVSASSQLISEFLASFVIPAVENSPERLSDPRLWTGRYGTDLRPLRGQHVNQWFIDDLKIAAALLHALFKFLFRKDNQQFKDCQELLKSLTIPKKFPQNIRPALEGSSRKPDSIAYTARCLHLVFGQYLKRCKIRPFPSDLKRFATTYIYAGNASLKNPDVKILDLVDNFLSGSQSYHAPHIPNNFNFQKRLIDAVWQLFVLDLIENLAEVYLNIHSRQVIPTDIPEDWPFEEYPYPLHSSHKAVLYKAIEAAFPPRQ